VFETVCASSLTMCAYQIGEHLTNRKKNRVRDRFIFYSRYSRRGTLLIQKSSGICSDETENWDLLVDCTSRDGRKMLDAGVHLSDKRTLLMKTHIPFQTQYNIFYRICFCFANAVFFSVCNTSRTRNRSIV
jgi:hypothetical protein